MEQQMDEFFRSVGLLRKKTPQDGSCLFRAVAEQVLLCQSLHTQVRARCVEYLRDHRESYEALLYERVFKEERSVLCSAQRGGRSSDLTDDHMTACPSSDDSDTEDPLWITDVPKQGVHQNRQKKDYCMAAGMQYSAGDQVSLETGGRSYSGSIRKVSPNSPVTVYVEELGKEVDVPLLSLRPVSESSWRSVAALLEVQLRDEENFPALGAVAQGNAWKRRGGEGMTQLNKSGATWLATLYPKPPYPETLHLTPLDSKTLCCSLLYPKTNSPLYPNTPQLGPLYPKTNSPLYPNTPQLGPLYPKTNSPLYPNTPQLGPLYPKTNSPLYPNTPQLSPLYPKTNSPLYPNTPQLGPLYPKTNSP
ncbi:hypothetical protein CRUP_017777, partial [Coryphaenoides rupestris]